MRDRGNDSEFHKFVCQEAESPTSVAGGGIAAIESDDLGLDFAVAEGVTGRLVSFLAAESRVQPVLNESLPDVADGVAMAVKSRCGLFVGPSRATLVNGQQDVGVFDLGGIGFAHRNKLLEFLPFLVGQAYNISLAHHSTSQQSRNNPVLFLWLVGCTRCTLTANKARAFRGEPTIAEKTTGEEILAAEDFWEESSAGESFAGQSFAGQSFAGQTILRETVVGKMAAEVRNFPLAKTPHQRIVQTSHEGLFSTSEKWHTFLELPTQNSLQSQHHSSVP